MRPYFRHFMLLGILLWLVLPGGSGPARASGLVLEANKGREGEPFEVQQAVARGKYTLVDFWSPHCPPCMKIAPFLEKLAAKRPDLRVVKLNIDRPGSRGIDWRSPLAQQYQLRSIPYMVIFDPQGRQIAQGQGAFDLFLNWLKEAGL
jgi:thiol-disulfide isomerase/thioredoxin